MVVLSNNSNHQAVTKLSEKTLPEITSKGLVALPQYDRNEVTSGIMHFGVGNFFRAHQAVFMDDLMNRGRDLNWGIVGANVIPQAEGQRTLMKAQDCLSMVVEQGAMGNRARVLGSLVEYHGTDDLNGIVDRLTDPAIRIVTLTITEGGYFLHPDDGGFDCEHPIVMEEAANPDRPKTTFGLIVAGLRRRWETNIQPFTIVSCDNILHNGVVTRNAVVGLATLIDPDLGRWVAETVAFPNGMVDRITPATSENERRRCMEEFGIADDCPVFCETFRQWVLEDNFPAGRPRLEDVGVMFVQDVTPYENMKLRILNGGHVVLGLVGSLMGIRCVHEVMQNSLARAFWRKVMAEEVVPSVPPVPCVDLYQYLDLIEERFANPKIEDTVQRLLLNGSDKIPKFVHPSVLARLERGEDCRGLALITALWCRYCYQVSQEDGGRLNDPAAELLMKHARMACGTSDAKAWLAMENIYSDPLMAHGSSFVGAFTDAHAALQHASGVEAILSDYVNEFGCFGMAFNVMDALLLSPRRESLPRRCSVELVAAELGRLLASAGDDAHEEQGCGAETVATIVEEHEQEHQRRERRASLFALTA